MNNKNFKKIIVSLLYAAIIVILLSPVTAYSVGTTEVISVTVPGFPGPKYATVYLPEGYDPGSTVRYRVVYFLHGAFNTHNSPTYNPVYHVMDSLIDNDLIEPIILVRPDGSAAPYLGSFWTNSALYGPYENWVYNYLVNYIDANYKTKAERNNRVIFGHSMGGYGAMKMALKHPELYRGVASLSGPLDLRLLVLFIPGIITEAGGGPGPYTFIPGATRPLTTLAYTLCGAFTPNLSNPPFYVNFLLDPYANIKPAEYATILTHNPTRLSSNISEASGLKIYFDCGYQDEYGFYYFNNAFRDTLNLKNIPYHYENFVGSHQNILFSRVSKGVQFLNASMNAWDPHYMIDSLITMINNYELPYGTGTALNAKLYSAQNYLYLNDEQNVCASLQDFINFVNAQKGKKITVQQANEMLEDLSGILDFVNCGSDGYITFENTEPAKFELKQNYPNPFNPVTTISYNIPYAQNVTIKIYDILGKEVYVLVNEFKNAGQYEVVFDASSFTSGTYFYKLVSGNYNDVKKLVIIK